MSLQKVFFRSSRGLRHGDPLSPMFFVIIVEALHALLEMANQARILRGYSVEHSSVEVSHLHFADDSIVFCDSTVNEIESLKAILWWFELMSGSKINYDKCEMISIRTDSSLLGDLDYCFGCKVGQLLLKYLGLPLCLGVPKSKLWDPMVERIDIKLSS